MKLITSVSTGVATAITASSTATAGEIGLDRAAGSGIVAHQQMALVRRRPVGSTSAKRALVPPISAISLVIVASSLRPAHSPIPAEVASASASAACAIAWRGSLEQWHDSDETKVRPKTG